MAACHELQCTMSMRLRICLLRAGKGRYYISIYVSDVRIPRPPTTQQRPQRAIRLVTAA